jgi:hypothetical protein
MRSLPVRVSVWLAVFGLLAIGGAQAAGASTGLAGRSLLATSAAPADARAHSLGGVPASSKVSFELTIALRNAAGAQAELRAVSTRPPPASTTI